MSSSLGRYKIPRPMQDEDKWFKYFTKHQLVYVGVSLVIIARLILWVKSSSSLVQIPVLTLGSIVVILSIAFGVLTMPDDKYLWGGGTKVETLVVRLVRKRLKGNRVLYVRNYKVDEAPSKTNMKERIGERFARTSS